MDIERDGGHAAVGGALGVAAVDAAGEEGQAVEGLVALGVVRDWVAGVDMLATLTLAMPMKESGPV